MIDGPIRVLLVDDDEDEFVNIRDLLNEVKGFEYSLTWKNSYNQGLKALQEVPPYHACLLDYRLGAETGIELLQEAKRLRVDCPIIFLTGHGDQELDLKAMRTGASEFLVKSQLTSPLLERSIRYAYKNHHDKKELRERERNFSTLLNSTFEGIIVHERGIIQEVNAAAGAIFGHSPADLINRPVWEFFHPDSRDDLKKTENMLGRGRLEVIALRADGLEVPVELLSRTVILKGQKQSLLALQDLTERKRMETQILQQDRLASLGLLSSSLAHEIGTPLGVIRGRAEIATNKAGSNEPLKQDLKIIISQIDRIAKLVDSLLHLARGKETQLPAPTLLSPVVQDVTNLVQHELTRKKIDLRVDVSPSLKAKAESGLLGQVLLNLLVNAVHAIEDAKKTRPDDHFIEIHAVEADDRVELSVRDSGNGIPEKNLNQLFKPFFTTKAIGQGTGLGLATSFNIVNSWNGTIVAKSPKGQGATFVVSLLKS